MKTEKVSSFKLISDKELVQRIVDEDEDAVEYLFCYLCRPIFVRIAKDMFAFQVPIDALISEFFIYLRKNNWQKIRSFQYKSKLTTWMTIVAIRFFNKQKNILTNLDESYTLIDIEQYNISNDSQSKIFEKIRIKELYDAVNQINNERYQWVLRAELSGLSKEEMAITLQTNISNVYNYIKRAKIQLANILREQ